MIYLIGSLRNPEIPNIANKLRKYGIDVFDSWYAAGPIADDCWRDYEKGKGLSYLEALKHYAAQHVFCFDKKYLDQCSGAILATPAGKSGHLELGYMIGQGKPGYILMHEEPERFDVMYNFATAVFYSIDKLVAAIQGLRKIK